MKDDRRSHEVRAALARLVSHGADAIWLPEAQLLLELPVVRTRIGGSSERTPAEALREALKMAVGHLGESQYRGLLTIVLDLDSEHTELSANERRALAGQTFRGGRSPVTAGTIRQYHEPRALSQLTEVLLSSSMESTSAADESGQMLQREPVIEWHPLAHEAWADERLHFWRVAFSVYDREAALDRMYMVMQKTDVRAWSMYELLGAYDILIKAWLPGTQRSFEDALHDAFRGDPALIVECFVVTDIVSHWLWPNEKGLSKPTSDSLAIRPADADLDRANKAKAGADALRPYQSADLLSVALPSEGIGIGFVMTISAPRHSSTSAENDGLRQQILAIMRESVFTEQSLYVGMGFGAFLMQGWISPTRFDDLGLRLVAPLNEALRGFGRRMTTLVLTTADPIAHAEAIRTSDRPEPQMRAIDWLGEDEGLNFEVMGSAFAPIKQWLEGEESPSHRPSNVQALLKAITGLLNSDGGTILIGALESRAFGEHPHLADAPRIGNYVICGMDHEIDGWPQFERRLHDAWRTGIEPDPGPHIELSVERIDGRTVCLVKVRAIDRLSAISPWFYQRSSRRGEARFFVRQGSTTRELSGVELDRYRRAMARDA